MIDKRRPQSSEGGEQRIDVVEFVARALGADPLKLLRDFLLGRPVEAAGWRTGGKAAHA